MIIASSAACTTALIDRLVHHSEIIGVEGESYRRREAEISKEATANRRRKRAVLTGRFRFPRFSATANRRLGLRGRRQHDARRTWLSTVLAGGANDTHAKWSAHGPPPTVLGSYTTMPWATLCKVVEELESIGSRAVLHVP